MTTDRKAIHDSLIENDRPLGAVLSLLTPEEKRDLLDTVEALRDQALTAAADEIARHRPPSRGFDCDVQRDPRGWGSQRAAYDSLRLAESLVRPGGI